MMVAAHDAGPGVGHPDSVLDVGDAAVENPEMTVQHAAVQYLDHNLGGGAIEEPKSTRLVRAGERASRTARAGALDRPADLDLEPTQQAEVGRPRLACRAGGHLGGDRHPRVHLARP